MCVRVSPDMVTIGRVLSMADEHNGAVGAPSTHLWGESAWLALDMWRISYTPGVTG